MNEDKFNIELRKFLKKVGITSQREIEKAVRDGVKSGALKGDESIAVKATLEIATVNQTQVIEGTIDLE